jgi:hypothetical protein
MVSRVSISTYSLTIDYLTVIKHVPEVMSSSQSFSSSLSGLS